jgi:deoxyribodipyrimidine photolyase-like uncharacterized protein
MTGGRAQITRPRPARRRVFTATACVLQPDHVTATPKQATGPDAHPFTTLYWDFLARHEKLLACDQQMTMQLRNLSRKSAADVRGIRWQADNLRGQLS